MPAPRSRTLRRPGARAGRPRPGRVLGGLLIGLAVAALLVVGFGAAVRNRWLVITPGPATAADSAAGGVVAAEAGEVALLTGPGTPARRPVAGIPEQGTLPLDSALGDVPLPPVAPDARLDSAGGAAAGTATAAELAALRAAMGVPVAGVARTALRDTWGEARSGGRTHEAIDIPAPQGTSVLAATDGEVAKLHNSVPGGLTVYVAEPGGRYMLLYGHLDAFAPGLREGARVRRGDAIGTVGTTGNAGDRAPHLHFGVARLAPGDRWWQGTPVNPWPLLRP